MPDVNLTMLNSMGGEDLSAAVARYVELKMKVVDLKDCIFGKAIAALSDDEAKKAQDIISKSGLSISCFSTGLFHDDIEKGAAHFREQHLSQVDRLIDIAGIMRPEMIRLLSARMAREGAPGKGAEFSGREHGWLVDSYREAIDRIDGSGFKAVIENEAFSNIFTCPEEINGFFGELDRTGKVSFIYDVQNLWQMGCFPSLDVLDRLKGITQCLHLKGGQKEEGGERLKWASSLEDASWPVAAILEEAIKNGVRTVCLNPSHGDRKPGNDYANVLERDASFAGKIIEGVEHGDV